MDLSSIEQIILQVPNASDSDVELYLDSVRDMKFGGDYSDMLKMIS
jgi:hypothetical protein